MTGTIVVVALDAADYRLATAWGCENMLLAHHGELETFIYGGTVPTTVEVWPTVATGVMPSEHGIVASDNAQDWEHPLLRLASSVTEHLPQRLRILLGKPFHSAGVQKEFKQTDVDHVFEDGHVFTWPGITDAEHLAEAWNLMFNTDGTSKPTFEGELFKRTGAEFAWAARMADTDAPVVGVHSHVLDIAGHAYADQESSLRSVYERVDRMLGWLRSEVDELVVLSDHGMQVSWLDDEEPGKHSMHPSFGTTLDGELPEEMVEIRPWLEARMHGGGTAAEDVDSSAPTEHLKELGYLQS